MTDQYKYCGLGRGRARVEDYSFNNVFHPNETQSMDVVDEEQDNHFKCICRRPKRILFCKTCEYRGTGRLKIRCSFHPRNEMLMDMVCCPVCRTHSSNMLEFDGEFETKQLQANDICMETADYPLSKVVENPSHASISNMQECNEHLEVYRPSEISRPRLENANYSNKLLFGIGRGRGISPLKRFMNENSNTYTNTPGMSPLRKEHQTTTVFSRLSFPSGNEVRRPGNFRDY